MRRVCFGSMMGAVLALTGACGEQRALGDVSADVQQGISTEEARLAPGATRWFQSGPSVPRFSSITADSEGSIIGVTDNWGVEVRVAKYDREGTPVWARIDPFARPERHASEFDELEVDASGRICARGRLEPLGPPNNAVVCFAPDGTNPVLSNTIADIASINGLGLGDGGELAVSRRWYGAAHTTLSYYHPGGSHWTVEGRWDSPGNGPGLDFGNEVEIDASGALLVPTIVHGRVTFQGQAFGEDGAATPAMLKFSPDGTLQWARTFDGLVEQSAKPYTLFDVATLSDGSIVALDVFSGTSNWGGQPETVKEEPMLMVMAADGAPQWSKALHGLSNVRLAVDPTGTVTVVGSTPVSAGVALTCQGIKAVQYNARGALLWERTIAPEGCDGEIFAADVASTDGEAVIAGRYLGTVDFGMGAVTAPERQNFLLKLERSPLE